MEEILNVEKLTAFDLQIKIFPYVGTKWNLHSNKINFFLKKAIIFKYVSYFCKDLTKN